MAKIINPDAHCSDCIWYEACNLQMYCKYLRKGITARKTPKYCRGYKNRNDYGAEPFGIENGYCIVKNPIDKFASPLTAKIRDGGI